MGVGRERFSNSRGCVARARSRVTLSKMLVKFSELVFLLHWNVKSALPLLRSSPRSPLYEWGYAFLSNAGGALGEHDWTGLEGTRCCTYARGITDWPMRERIENESKKKKA